MFLRVSSIGIQKDFFFVQSLAEICTISLDTDLERFSTHFIPRLITYYVIYFILKSFKCLIVIFHIVTFANGGQARNSHWQSNRRQEWKARMQE